MIDATTVVTMQESFFNPEIQALVDLERRREAAQARLYTLQVQQEVDGLLGVLSDNTSMVCQWYKNSGHLQDAIDTDGLIAELADNKAQLTRWLRSDTIPDPIGDTPLPDEKAIMLSQAERNVYFSLWKAPEKYRNDREVATAAVRANPTNFDYVSERLKGNRAFVLELFELGYIGGRHMSSISMKLRDDM